MPDDFRDSTEYDLAPDAPDGGAEWYYAQGEQRRGPVSTEELRRLVRFGEVAGDQLGWRAGMADWAPLNTIPELRPIFAGPRPDTPPTPLSYRGPQAGRPLEQGEFDAYAGQATSALVLGILSIIFALCCAPIGLILGIIAVVQGGNGKRSTTNGGQAQAGWVCGIIGLILSVVSCAGGIAINVLGS